MIWAAVRYRPAQALLLAVLAALVVGCAAFAPLYERALAQSLLRDGLSRMPPTASAITLSTSREQGSLVRADPVAELFPASLNGLYGQPVQRWSGRVFVPGRNGTTATTLWATPSPCDGLTLDAGRCPQAAFEVLASTEEARIQGWALGAALGATEIRGAAPGPPFATPVTLVGTYTQREGEGPWADLRLGGKAGRFLPGLEPTPLMDALVSAPATFAPDQQAPSAAIASVGWRQLALELRYPLDRDALTLEQIAQLPTALDAMGTAAALAQPRVRVETAMGELAADVVEGRRQVLVIVPLLMAQLALLAVVLLGLVAGAAIEQRRPELALARLRGAGTQGATRLVLGELGMASTLGAPVGLLGAIGAAGVARALWLAPGVPAELPPTALLAAALGLLLSWAAILIAVRPVVREPVAALLRRVPARRTGARLGLVDAAAVGVSVAGLAALWAGNLFGPLALATPALLSLAVGLLLAHLLVPVSAAAARAARARGQLARAIAFAQIARRPAVRRVVTIVTVATALVVFAANALVVGQRNREDRSRVETGAALVLSTDATDPALVSAVLTQLDPLGEHATPVAWIRQASSDSMTTMAVVPGQFGAVADLAVEPGAFDLTALQAPVPSPAMITGRTLRVTIGSSQLSELNLYADPAGRPISRMAGQGVPFEIKLVTRQGKEFQLGLDLIPLTSSTPTVMTAEVDCEQGCAIISVGIARKLTDERIVKGSFTVAEITGDAGPPADIGRPGLWLPKGTRVVDNDLRPYAVVLASPSLQSVTLEFISDRTAIAVSSAVVAAAIPALVVGSLPAGTGPNESFQGAGLDGLAVRFQPVGRLPYVPGGGTPVALVSLPALLTRASTLAPVVGRLQVYLDDPALEAPMRAALAGRGISVLAVARQADRQASYDASASASGLRLAAVIGALAVLLAALVLVLVAATGWRGRARDYAALRMAGVGVRSLRRASIVEQGTVVAVAAVVGAACGLVASALALPMVPLFTRPSPTFVDDFTPAPLAVLGSALAALGGLVSVALVVGLHLVRRARLDRLREQL